MLNFTVIRSSNRKTASISVSPDNKVSILVPEHLPDQKIDKLIQKKLDWIRRKIKFNQEVRYPHKDKEYVSGESFSYLGRNYRLKIMRGKPNRVELKNGRLVVHTNMHGKDREESIKSQLGDWYKAHALIKLRERVNIHSKRVGVAPGDIKIKTIKSQWGSCTKTGGINFNWKIIMAPMSIVDYVVVHELCHLVHHDHSKAYWKLLELVLPVYLEKKEWLRVNGAQLRV